MLDADEPPQDGDRSTHAGREDGGGDALFRGLKIFGDVARTLLRSVVQEADLEDISQNAVLRLLRNAKFLDCCDAGAAEELERLSRVVLWNEYISFLRRSRRSKALPLDALSEAAIVAPTADGSPEEAEARIARLAKRYPDLPQELWTVLGLAAIDGTTKSEAASDVGIDRRAFYRLLSDLRARLKRDGDP